MISFAKKMNIKYEDLQYAGAVHLESGHPHLQVMMWSKQKEKMNYFIKYNIINDVIPLTSGIGNKIYCKLPII